MTNIAVAGSSWVRSLSYCALAPDQKQWARKLGEKGDGLLVVATTSGNKIGWLVPSFTIGLLAAAKARGQSVGKAINKLVRGRYPSVKVG